MDVDMLLVVLYINAQLHAGPPLCKTPQGNNNRLRGASR